MFALGSTLNIFKGGIPLILSYFLIISWASGVVDAEVIEVCQDGCNYSTISSGVYYAQPGDVVKVKSGIYNENVIIKKPITVRGFDTGAGRPIINASFNESGFIISGDGVTLDGFEINNSKGSFFDLWAGIKVESDNNTISDNTVYNSENGIFLSGSGMNILRGNVLVDNRFGLKVENSSNNTIQNNTLNSNKFGALLSGSKNNKLMGNNVSCNTYCGIELEGSTGNILRDNLMQNNTYNFAASGRNDIDKSNLVNFRPVYYLVGLFDQKINSSRAGAAACIDCINMTFENLSLEKNLKGMYLFNTSRSTIIDCRTNDSQNGIDLENSNGNVLRNITAFNNTLGIYILNCTNNSISFSNIYWNNEAGISLKLSNESTIEGSILSQNMQGIIIAESDNNQILSNNLSNNLEGGLLLSRSIDNRISMNRFSKNRIGIELQNPWKTQIYKNDIIKNEVGLSLKCGIKNNIYENNISNNDLGISLDKSGNNTISNPLFNNTKDEEEMPPCSMNVAASGTGTPGIEVTITSDPEGAEARIEGDYKGDTPIKVSLERGEYPLKLELEGHETNVSIIRIPGPKEINIPLTKKDN
jgi:parallel beta-helix repeat protein